MYHGVAALFHNMLTTTFRNIFADIL